MSQDSETRATAASPALGLAAGSDLGRELLGAIAEIERGDCIELTPEQLARCTVDGEWPWPDAFPD